jgi:hypothetical protein
VCYTIDAMISILHRVGFQNVTRPTAFGALASFAGLSAWWTPHLSGRYEIGSVFTAGFPDVGPELAIAEIEEPARVLWRCSGGPEEWIGSWMSFDLRQGAAETILLFRHDGWRDASELVHHCSTQWAYFLLGLKAYLERGKRRAFGPDCEPISSWSPCP